MTLPEEYEALADQGVPGARAAQWAAETLPRIRKVAYDVTRIIEGKDPSIQGDETVARLAASLLDSQACNMLGLNPWDGDLSLFDRVMDAYKAEGLPGVVRKANELADKALESMRAVRV